MRASDTDLLRQARLYHGDGLVDLSFGLVVMGLGLAELFGWEMSVLFIFVLLWMPLMQALKQRITAPRMRTVSISPPSIMERRQRRTLLITAASMAIVLVLFLAVLFIPPASLPGDATAWLRRAASLLWPAVVLGVLLLFAWTLNVKRVYLYVGLLVIVALSGAWFPAIAPTLFLLLGAGITIVGAILLTRFVRGHPLPDGAAPRGV
jgi:hypothetical protein